MLKRYPKPQRHYRVIDITNQMNKIKHDRIQYEQSRYNTIMMLLRAQHDVLEQTEPHKSECSQELCGTAWLLQYLALHPPGE